MPDPAPTPSAPTAAGLQPVSDEVHAAAEEVVRDELARWAAEIHDDLTQSVAAAILELQVLDAVIARDPGAAREMLQGATEQLRGAMADVREVLFHLTEAGEHPTDLAAVVAEAESRWNITVDADIPDLASIPPSTLETAGLVIREAIANAATHAGGDGVAVTVVNDGSLRVTIRDSGPGPLPESRDRHHFGMRIMERRVHLAGGRLDLRPAEPSGTQITAVLPLRGAR